MKFTQFLPFLCFAAEAKTVLVVDAGSSSTRGWVYVTDTAADACIPSRSNLESFDPLPSRMGLRPGLHKIDPTKDEIQSYLEPLMSIKKIVQPDDINVHIFGTGGLRGISSPEETFRVASEIFPEWDDRWMRFNVQSSRTLTEEEEGMFGVISAQYLSNMEVVGILDLGGSSFEFGLSISPHKKLSFDQSDFLVSSWPLGSRTARNAVFEKLEKDGGDLVFPCAHPGQFVETSSGATFRAESEFSADRCRNLIVQSLDLYPLRKFKSDIIPGKRGRFQAISNAAFPVDFLHTLNPDAFKNFPVVTRKELFNEAFTFCSLEWTEVQTPRMNVHQFTPEEKVGERCFELQLVLLMFDILEVWKHFEIAFSPSIDGVGLEWTLGAMLAEESKECSSTKEEL